MSEPFATLATEYEKALFEYQPELGLFWGRSDVVLDRFMDVSQEAYAKWLVQEDDFLARLHAIQAEVLPDAPSYSTYLLLKEDLENKIASRMCREELWDVNPASGWHNAMAMVAEKQPVGTVEYRQLALKRWRTFGIFAENHINNLKLGLRLGYSAPQPAVKRVIVQLDILLDIPVNDSPFFEFARRDGDETFKMQVADLIQAIIYPALKHYRDYLEHDYLPIARSDIGMSALPGGAACYQAKIKQETTLSLTPKAIHDLGLEVMQGLSKEVSHIGWKRYGTKDMALIFQKAQHESSGVFFTEEDILKYNVAALEKAKTAASSWFDLMPKAESIIRPYPIHRAKTGASGEYYPPNEEGTDPGIFYINTYEPQTHSRIDQEATLFHELIPGHHFQIALVYENKTLPRLNRYLFNAGFGEGWALYAERLADEMGLYQDDISRLGMLSNAALRAARLVVDTGIHAFHWKREDAVDYLKRHTALNDAIIEGEVDRYMMLPGQAVAYMLGKNEIESLRHTAQMQLGSQFDIREFHNQVLKHGMVSLPILRMHIEHWLHDLHDRKNF
ncbi:MAG: DUF885 domain-containing protein [Legionella sp.]|nr:MAG: DUF885 domain-containing protein [Legionella sp.]